MKYLLYTKLSARSFLSHDNTLAYTGVTETERSRPSAKVIQPLEPGPSTLMLLLGAFST